MADAADSLGAASAAASKSTAHEKSSAELPAVLADIAATIPRTASPSAEPELLPVEEAVKQEAEPAPAPNPAAKIATSNLNVPAPSPSSHSAALLEKNRKKKKMAALIAQAKLKPLPPTPSASDAAASSSSTSAAANAAPASQGSIPLAAPIPAIDHLIHRCANIDDLQTAIKTWTALGFTVLEGGQHADGLSRNALIVFADGAYIEFIAFEDEPTNPDGTPIKHSHSRSASSGHDSWLSTFRRDRSPPAAPDSEKGKEKSAAETETERGSRPAHETKEEFLSRRAQHWWWNTPSKGWIDFCFTTGVAPATQKREYIAEAKRGGPHRTPSLHRTAIVNANAAEASKAKAQQAGPHASSTHSKLTESKPMPALPRPLPESLSASSHLGSAGSTIGGHSKSTSAALSLEADAEDELVPVTYDRPLQLGRRTKDGKDLQFEVIFPLTARRRVPFFCEDITPRDLRVPPSASKHPNGSTGLSAITLLYATTASFQQALAVLCPLLGVNTLNKVLYTHPVISSTTVDLRIRTPSSLSLSNAPTAAIPAPVPAHSIPLHLRVAQDVQEIAHVQKYGEGVYELEIMCAADRLVGTAPPDGIERTTALAGYGRVRLHPVFGSTTSATAEGGVGGGPAGRTSIGSQGSHSGGGAGPATGAPLKQATV
ncbi:hypothetical protein V8E36_004596 [Tilletia maclaganii]